MRVSVTIPDDVVKMIDEQCLTPDLRVGVSSGRSRWIALLILNHLQVDEELFNHNRKRGPKK